jgi:hypothetical protein
MGVFLSETTQRTQLSTSGEVMYDLYAVVNHKGRCLACGRIAEPCRNNAAWPLHMLHQVPRRGLPG